MNTLFILNDAPYGTERSYNGLRLARTLLNTNEAEVKVFLMGDAAACAKGGHTPHLLREALEWHINLEETGRMLAS